MTCKAPEVEVVIKIPFHDVDLMEVTWHGHYLKYMEIARGALLDSFGYNYLEMRESGFAWPVIDARIRYIKPARLGQKIRIKARLVEYDLRLKIDFLVTDAETGERIARAHTTQVAFDMRTQKMHLGSPPVLYEKLGVES